MFNKLLFSGRNERVVIFMEEIKCKKMMERGFPLNQLYCYLFEIYLFEIYLTYKL